MHLEDYFDFLSPEDIRIRGSRVGIEHVLYEFIHQRQSPEAIARQFPTIDLEQVYATILYYLHNKDSVSAYLSDCLKSSLQAQAEQDRNPSPVVTRLRQLKAQRQAEPKPA